MPHMSRPIVVVFPAFNEEPTVGAVIRRTPREVMGHPVEVVVVDDGSADGTAAAALAAGATVHAHGVNRGLGAAVRTGLAFGVDRDAAAIAFLDADGEYAPEELERLVAPILAGRADYVAGSRFAGMPRRMLPHRWVGNRVLTIGVRVLVRRWGVRDLTDAQSGYRALSWRAAAAAEIVHDFNYAQVLTLDLLAKGFRYAEVPISYGFRRHGQSFVRLGPYLRRVLPGVWRELASSPTRATPATWAPVDDLPTPDVVTCAAASAHHGRAAGAVRPRADHAGDGTVSGAGDGAGALSLS
jgi:glycosyltransferase involved in cell wall biosynthesis